MKTARFLSRLLGLGILAAAACGPVPPDDPFNLGQAKDSLNRGHYWYLRGCQREAGRFFHEGLAYARLADSVPLMVMSRNSLGAAYLAEGRLDEAARQLSEALEMSLTAPDRPEMDSILGSLGTLAFRAGRLQDAEDLWNEALAASPPARQAIYLANLARLYQSRNRPDDYLALTARALEASQTPDTPPEARADALALAAGAALEAGDWSLAETYITEGLALDRQKENPAGLAQDLEILAQVQLNREQWPQAAQSLDRSFYLWAAIQNKEGLERTWKLLEKTRQKGWPKDLAPYREVRNNPRKYDLLSQTCP
jgi:tetratricopeptide (TPR) repeat protein